ncbi:hypothetical protein BH24ACT26_BH24ACT26_01970 [soil metagenome]
MKLPRQRVDELVAAGVGDRFAVLANAPEFVDSMREADDDLAARRTSGLDDYLKKLHANNE